MDKTNFTITVQRVIKEQYSMTLEAETAMQAYDMARKMVDTRNTKSTSGKYSVTKVEKENA